MTRSKKILAASLVLLALFVVAAPIGPVPGFFIGGKQAPVPEVWPATADVDEIRLQVPGTPPRVVVIWLVQIEGVIYVVGNVSSGWVQRIGEQATVAMRLNGSTYKLKATRTRENTAAIVRAYKDKYRADYPDIVAGFPSEQEALEKYAVFQLNPPLVNR